MASSQTALVARAAGSVGRCVSERFADAGYDVALTFDQDEAGAQAAAKAVREAGQTALVLGGRIADPMVAPSLVRRTRRELGTPCRLVVGPRRDPIAEADTGGADAAEAFLGVSLAEVEPVLAADLKGPLALLQAAAGAMREDDALDEASAVLVAPAAELRSGPVGAPARAAAAGLVSIVEAAGQALAPQVHVNALIPGLIRPHTAATEEHAPRVDLDALDLEEVDGLEVDHWIDPDELADAIVHLACAPGSVTGQTLRVDRGLGDDALTQRPWQRGEDAAAGLPGLDKRVEPPDPEERIDLDEAP